MPYDVLLARVMLWGLGAGWLVAALVVRRLPIWDRLAMIVAAVAHGALAVVLHG